MTNDATLAPAGATEPPPPPCVAVPAAPRTPAIGFDSSAFDTLSMRTAEIGGLASCMTCLVAVERSEGGSFSGYELIEDALPMLGGVIMRLAREAGEAGDQLFAQYQEARDFADGRQA